MDVLPLEIRILLFATLACSVAAGLLLPPPRRVPSTLAVGLLSAFSALAFVGASYCLLADLRAPAALAVALFVHATVALMWATRRREDGGGPGPGEDGGGWDDGPSDPVPDGGGGTLPADWWESFTRDFWEHVERRERVAVRR